MNFLDYKDVEDFKQKTGMDSIGTLEFLVDEIIKMKDQEINELKEEVERLKNAK